MNGFQIAGLVLVVTMLLVLVAGVFRGHLRKRVALFWIAVWTGGAVLLVRPEYSRVMAKVLGIGRGTDLLLYCTVLASTTGFLWAYVRLRRVDRQLTQLVREIALQHPIRLQSSAVDREPKT